MILFVSFLYFLILNLTFKAAEIKNPISIEPAKDNSSEIHLPISSKNPDGLSSITDFVEQLLDPTPKWNDFNKTDQIVIDEKTKTFYIYHFSNEVFELFEDESNYLVNNGATELIMDLHSGGGDLMSTYAMIEQIKILNQKGVKIIMKVDDKNACMSACVLFFLSGNERIATDNSVFMIHAPYMLFGSKIREPVMIVLERELRADKDIFVKALENSCPNDKTIKLEIFDYDDHFHTTKDLGKRCTKFFDKITSSKTDKK